MTLKTVLKATIAATALGLGLAGTTTTAQAAQELTCDSNPGGYNYCRTSTAAGVTLLTQRSRYGCYQNDTWGYDSGGIWVANGCSATFRIGREDKSDNTAAAVGLGILALAILGAGSDNNDDGYNEPPPPPPPPPPQGYPGGYPPPGGYPQGGYQPPPPPPPQGYPPGSYQQGYNQYYGAATIIPCNSRKNKYQFCAAPVRNYVELVQQRSKSSCRFNKSWGYDRKGVWVNKGCRADFAIY